MSRSESPVRRYAPLGLALLGLVAALLFAANFPAVEGLGTKVRLPVFHGAMTWINLAAFTLMALVAVAYLFTRRESWYAWEEGLRWVAVPMWLVGSVLGFAAAFNTWDFTGSKASPLEAATADPRLAAQLWILIVALALIALSLLVDERRLLAGADVAFAAFMWGVLLRAILGPGRALHPDSPVMNSDELIIKAIFFGIVGGIGVMAAGLVWAIARMRLAAAADRADIAEPEESAAQV